MELSKILNSIRVVQVVGEVERKDASSIAYDSRKVKKNSIFVAIPGFITDGHKFILDAINKGASAVVLEKDHFIPEEIFHHRNVLKILVKDSRKALAEISNCFFKEPSKNLILSGITGTKGKTTTSYFIKNIFETAGYKTGLIGTIANYIGEKQIYTSLTTPESSDLNELFSNMLSENCSHCVMEVSSHSLVLNRVSNIKFKSAIFTNITSDHMDFHNTFDEYLKAKKILFDNLDKNAICVYNNDDPYSKKIIVDTKAVSNSYGTIETSDFCLRDINFNLEGTSFIIVYKGDQFNLKTILVGKFNAYNAAAAFANCLLLGISPEVIIRGIASTPQVPGRFEAIIHKGKTVIVDYSHTADSLEKTLQAIQSIVKSKKPIYTVFGCGGNRDRTKRPVMGKIAGNLSKKVFVTSDNPRFEEPMAIIDEIVKGIEKKNYEIIENREDAIKTAIKNTEDDAVILIAGKGHENYQEIKGVRSHLSDKEIAEKHLFYE
jgi:UDP-N-acetylmuramoyl-L-alanyl-D-glutamate--2,6-diaminopimelate ligase